MPISGGSYTLPTNNFAQPVPGNRVQAVDGAATLTDIETAIDTLVGSIGDGDKGDITVSSNGTVWNIDASAVGTTELANSAVTLAKLANQNEATALFRLPNAGSGPPIAATMQQVRSAIGMFDTRAALAAAYMAGVLNYARTAGYTTQGDDGGALYKRVGSEPSHPGKVQSADGTWWEIAEPELNFYQFGAVGDGVTDDRDAIADCISCASAVNGIGYGHLIVPGHGTFLMGSSVTIPNNNNGVSQIVIEGSGRYTTFIKASSSFSGTQLFDIQGVCDISHIGFDGNSKTISCFINNQAALVQIATRIHHCNFVSFAGTSGVYRNNTNGVYEFYRNTIGSCVLGVYNYDWGTGSRIQDNDILTSGTAIILDNNGASNEGIYIQNNFIGSTGSHGIQINKGLDIYIQNNSITPINYAGGYSGIIITGSVGPVRIESNWLEGFKCEVSCSDVYLENNYFPAALLILFNGPSSGSISNCRIIGNTFAGAGVASRISLTNCANFIVADNMSAGPFFETGGTLQMEFRGNFLAGTSSLSSACTLVDNFGGSGYTNDLVTTPTGTTVNGTFSATGNSTVGGTFGVTGATTLAALSATTGSFSSTLAATGDFAINTNKFNVTASSGNTAIAGTLAVTGTSTLAAVTATTGAFTGVVNFGDGGGTADVNLLKNVNGQRWFVLRNTNSGASASSGFLFGDDVTGARAALVINSTNRTDLAGANSMNFGTFGNDNFGFFTGNTLRLMFRGADGLIDYKFAAVTAGAPFTNTAKVPVYINGVAYNIMLCA